MNRLLACGMALALSTLALAFLAGAPDARERILEVCGSEKERIDARDLPATIGPGECPAGERVIFDGPVAAVVPPSGESVYAEVLTTTGAQTLSVGRAQDGTIRLNHVGEEPEEAFELGRAANREGCRSSSFNNLAHKVVETAPITYELNFATAPRGLKRTAFRNATLRAARNVFDTRNGCRMGDRVPASIRYGGKTGLRAQAGDGLCGQNDGRNVVAFGSLRRGVLALACFNTQYRPAYEHDQITHADVEINRAGVRWTTKPNRRSCRKAYDVEGVMTHEWGHVFGLGHVAESGSRNLTMSPAINGPCQSAERSLGRGDVLGLDGKYPND